MKVMIIISLMTIFNCSHLFSQDTILIDSRNPSHFYSKPLINCVPYQIIIQGTFSAWDLKKNEGIDAFYYYDVPEESSHHSDTPIFCGCLRINDSIIDPIPDYKSDHIYTIYFLGDGNRLSFNLPDLYHNDNSGIIKIIILQFEGCDIRSFKYKNFSNIGKLNLVKDTKQSEEVITLTPSEVWNGGAVWYEEKMPVKKGFTTEFSFRISEGVNKYHPEKYPGADGLSFIIQNYQPDAIGSLGGSIGFRNIPNSIAFEFDTYYNEFSRFDNFNDPNENHIGVFSNGTENNQSDHLSSACIATNDSIIQLMPDERIFYSKIDYCYSSQVLKIWLDSNDKILNEPVLVINDIDISQLLNLDCEEFAWVGFTSATGIVYEKHELLSWSFCASPTNTILTSVNDSYYQNDDEGSLSIFPNPADEQLNIRFCNSSKLPIIIKVFDVFGRQVLECNYPEVKYEFKMDVNELTSGVYFLELVTKENKLSKQFTIIR